MRIGGPVLIALSGTTGQRRGTAIPTLGSEGQGFHASRFLSGHVELKIKLTYDLGRKSSASTGDRMEKENSNQELPPISPETRETVSNAIKEMFDLFTDQAKRMAKSLEQFKAKREEVEQRIKNGAKRTSGRIV
jgi:hypothetical protein